MSNVIGNKFQFLNMEKEPIYLYPDQKFSKLINEKFDLWTSVIDDSDVSAETKTNLKRDLNHFQNDAHTSWQTLDDAFYFTISTILTTSKKDKNKDEARALFENLRDDIWSLFKEIKN